MSEAANLFAPVEPSSRHVESSPPELNDSKLFINRQLSWLAFNDRVLDEARDRDLPIYERLKFLAIFSSNIDEFFMVRVAGLKQQMLGGVVETPADGMLPAEQLAAVSDRVHAMVARQYRIYREHLTPALAYHSVKILKTGDLSTEQLHAAKEFFSTNIFPALTPLAVDPGHPFPQLRNKSLNIAVVLRRQGRRRRKDLTGTWLAVVQVPSVLARFVRVPSKSGYEFVLLEEIIASFASELFPGYTVQQTAPFRVTRNWDLLIDEEESEDLLSTVQEELRRRDRGAAVRLELTANASVELEHELTEALKLSSGDVYRLDGPLQLSDLHFLPEADRRPELRVDPLSPVVPIYIRDADSMVSVVGKRDVLLHHPYEAFDPVVRFIEEAAEDPAVLAIKQTLYRTSGDSPIVRALTRAADNGKQVTVLVEIKARFDEANNIAWARRLEDSGVHVVYGLIGLKTHCKVALVVRKESKGIRRYVHLGTGNYNPMTARQYTDLSFFTARPELTDDVSALFNMLTGYAETPQWKRLSAAPFRLQERLVDLIRREATKAAQGEPARIVAKMNSLVDSTVIRALYEASHAGVEIDLIVRGICCLRPGVPGISEKIRVTSVVDRFLEHSRVFAFGTGDKLEVYMSSADWMPRNFVRRVEVMFPIEDIEVRGRIMDEILGLPLRDTVKARRLQMDGTYLPYTNGAPVLRSQTTILERVRRANDLSLHEPIIRPVPPPQPSV